jgi:acyl-CoA synthetase (AMP-forming)/AMP-acid ligase II
VAVAPHDPHIILYTSGTTGFPKGALFSHAAHYLHALSWALMTNQQADDVGLLVYPLFHTGGPDCVLLPHFLLGATVVLLDGADPAEMLRAIERHRATNVFCVPTVWRRLLAALDAGRNILLDAGSPGGPSGPRDWSPGDGPAVDSTVARRTPAPGGPDPTVRRPPRRGDGSVPYDVSSVRRCLGSSDTLPADLLDGILQRFDADVYVTYGLTEAGCILTYSKLTRQRREKIHSVGKPHPLVELRLAPPDGEAAGGPAGEAGPDGEAAGGAVGDAGEVAESGQVGEVLARGPTLMDGYWDMPEKTAEAMAGGWLHTGDLGRYDEAGYLYLVGRAKDVIVTGGEKVYPLEVEKLLEQVPGVARAALVGVPDPEWGEAVLACIVRAAGPEGQHVTAEALQQYVRARLAGYKQPRYLEFVEALPATSATNKVQKSALRDRFRDKYLALAEERIRTRGLGVRP